MKRVKENIKYFLEDYLLLRKKEQVTFYTIALVILVVFTIGMFMPRFFQDRSEDLARFDEFVEAYRQRNRDLEKPEIQPVLSLKSFDVNKVTIQELTDMGLSVYAAKSIVNYRNSINGFKSIDQLLICYGVDSLLYQELIPFAKLELVDDHSIAKPKLALKTFDPNTVSRGELESMQLPERFINSFLNFRNAGARFYKLSDIQKVYGLDDALFKKMRGYLVFPNQLDYDKETKESSAPIAYFMFDPNSISKDSLILLGIAPRVAQTWINYRSTGAKFYNEKDLRKIIGLTDDNLKRLLPWLDFPSPPIATQPERKRLYVQPSLNLDLNLATKEDLEKIYGVGPNYANAIIWHRRDLSGFLSIEQISEIEYIPDSVFVKIKHHFIDPIPTPIQKININEVSRRTLADHPYCNYTYADDIVALREINGKYTSMADLEKFEIMPKDEYVRLKPYLTHE